MLRTLTLIVVILLGTALPALAAHPDTKSDIENLKQRIRTLETQLGQKPATEGPFSLRSLNRYLTFSGLLELEASYNKVEGGDESSDLNLATAQLSTEAAINDRVNGHLILLYEEDGSGNESIKADEAVISLSCPQSLFGQTPAFHGGKMYIPFGKFNSSMVSDPLPLDLGETNNTAAMFALEGSLWNLSLGVFNGETDSRDDNNRIDSLVAALEISPLENLRFGFSWLSDLAESDAGLVADTNLYSSSVAAASAFLSLAFDHVAFEAEILGALDDFDRPLVGLTDLSGERPLAWDIEATWMPTDRTQLVARAEGADDFQDDPLRFGVTGSYGIFANTVVAMEYLYTDPETAPRNHSVTGQLAFEF
ncbi:LbtU family siderophore porin [Geothermobacter hydrogeniphilus]|uniref:LbtU family siderophore porin n=1 Tax=Geothermobacter hydrogeniphilus TaxID=1969733 RepID=A0A1X0YA35_9BACT|nr:LbtU family siderophore porin [Geothermobacter hydrogeniphilus]ORJ62038.1 hypothetical protein B5V00_04610 [Geothermobacter hydrogeniphilus]